jgi:uncharacterized repeat protein (TIGR03803 family)
VKPLSVRQAFLPQILALAASALSLTARAENSFTTLHTFDPDTDGNVPYAALLQGADGKFYGLNTTGGRSGNGTIFSITPGGGDFDVLNTFTQSDQGYQPEGGLVQASDGNFYGATSEGGANGYGTLYQVIPSTGKLKILFAFADGNPGANPVGALIQGLDGFLYGTAEFGGADTYGTVFRADISTGVTTVLAEIGGGADGIEPESDLIQGTDGNFYGTTSQGGANDLGTIFQITPEGAFTVLYTFTGGTDGGTPERGVIQGTDGAFYGVANAGGIGGAGLIYKLTVTGTTAAFTTIYAFEPTLGDGTNAIGGLVQASDGNFYGTTSTGGSNGDGTVYRVTPAGGFLTIYDFTDSGDSGDPISGLTQGIDGRLYGTTAGESDSDGSIYAIDLGLAAPTPVVTLFTPTSANVGNTIEVDGRHLVGTTAVSFTAAGGKTVAATSFSLASGTYLTAVVPTGAITGPISVTANGLTGTSTTDLDVTGTTPPVNTGVTVNVVASDPVAAFEGNNEGRFKITRTTNNVKAPLTVLFGFGANSTAVRGKDYNLATQGETLATVTRSITIPAGETSVGLKVVPIPDSDASRPDRNVILLLRAGAGYKLGSEIRAKVSIAGYTGE